MCVRERKTAGADIPQHVCRSQRTTFGINSLLHHAFTAGIKLKSGHWAYMASTCIY